MDTIKTRPIYTRKELMEHFGLQIHDNTDGLTGKNASATRIRYAEMPGASIGEFLARPPANPDCRQTRAGRVEHDGWLHWSLRAEGPHWQGDIFIKAEARPDFDPVYQYLDHIQEAFPHLLEAVENADLWPQRHHSIADTITQILHHRHGRNGGDPTHLANLDQRYG
jgi:hypothetical protein